MMPTACEPFFRSLAFRLLAGIGFGWLAAALAPVACVIAVVAYRAPDFPAQDWRIVLAMAFVFAGGYALLVGVPIALALRANGWLRALPMLTVGFLVGAGPMGVGTFPAIVGDVSPHAWAEWWQG